jgi:hypothetical protein
MLNYNHNKLHSSYPQSCSCAENGVTSTNCELFRCNCVCDVTAGKCDYDCCCDPDCSSDQVRKIQWTDFHHYYYDILYRRYLVSNLWVAVHMRAMSLIRLNTAIVQMNCTELILELLWAVSPLLK